MQGINKARHVHLMDALLQLESLLNRKPQEFGCLQQTADYRVKLESMHRDYEKQLADLYVLIAEYETLFKEVKVQYLGRNLRNLQKHLAPETKEYRILLQTLYIARHII